MIACEVCGTRNEEKLTFCRTCGHRLKTKKRAVPPTPASAIKKAKLPSEPPDDEDSDWQLDDVPARHSRPSAPVLDLEGKREDDVPEGKVKCSQCSALSPKEYRFCISCGAVLRTPPKRARTQIPGEADAAPEPRPDKAAKPSARRELDLDKPRPRSRVEPPAPPPAKARLDKLKRPAPAAAADAELGDVQCEACDGVNDGEAAFCKYCGAALPKERRRAVPKAPPPRREPAAPLELGARASRDPFPLAKSLIEDDAEELDLEPVAPPARPATAKGVVEEPPTGKLVVIVEDGSEGRALELRGRQMDIGSREGDIILAEDRYLSPRHARLFRQGGAWYLRDLSSVNGVYRRLRKPTVLKHGDLVLLGLEVLEFEVVDHAERGLGHAIQHGVLVFGSPAATRRARLCQRTVEGIVRDVYHLVAEETTVGRETGDIVFTSDPFMSRRHATFQWDEETQEYVLIDLNSSNGTYLAIRDDVRLEHGDFIRLGQHLFRVDLPSADA